MLNTLQRKEIYLAQGFGGYDGLSESGQQKLIYLNVRFSVGETVSEGLGAVVLLEMSYRE